MKQSNHYNEIDALLADRTRQVEQWVLAVIRSYDSGFADMCDRLAVITNSDDITAGDANQLRQFTLNYTQIDADLGTIPGYIVELKANGDTIGTMALPPIKINFVVNGEK